MKAEARERERQHQAELHERRDASKLFEEYKVSGPLVMLLFGGPELLAQS